MTKLEEKEATSSTELDNDYYIMKRELSMLDCSSLNGNDTEGSS